MVMPWAETQAMAMVELRATAMATTTTTAEPSGDGDTAGGNSGDGDGDNSGGSPGDGDGDGAGGSTGGADPNGCGAQGALSIPVTYRDFSSTRDDFHRNPEPCTAGPRVELTLDENGDPIWGAPGEICLAAADFLQWYVDSDESTTIESTLILYPNGDGGFANRHDESGERFQGVPVGTVEECGAVLQVAGCEDAQSQGMCGLNFDPAVHECWEMGSNPLQALNGTILAEACCTNCFCAGDVTIPYFDGDPLFFPLRSASSSRLRAPFVTSRKRRGRGFLLPR